MNSISDDSNDKLACHSMKMTLPEPTNSFINFVCKPEFSYFRSSVRWKSRKLQVKS